MSADGYQTLYFEKLGCFEYSDRYNERRTERTKDVDWAKERILDFYLWVAKL